MHRFKSLLLVIFLALTAASCGRTKPMGDGNLSLLRLLPQDPVLYLGQMVHLTVEAHLANGTLRDVTSDPDLLLRVNDPGVVTLLEDGWIHTIAPGQVLVLASWGGKQAKTSLKVLDGNLIDLQVSPSYSEVDSGKSVQLEVQGELSDGSTLDLTQAAMGTSYSADRPAVATPTADGLVFAMNQGVATVMVANGDFSSASVFSVGGGQSPLVAITLSPDAAQIPVGSSLALKLVGSYSDGTVKDLTNDPEAIYSSSNEQVVLVDRDGLVSGLYAGRAEVTAVYRNLFSTSSITVSGSAKVVGIDVLPKDAFLALGSSLQFKTMAVFDDGGQVDVTPLASYSSSLTMVASVDAQGLLQALSPGRVDITVEYSGFSDLVQVRVLDAELVNLWIEQEDFSLNAGESRQIIVMGKFSDGSIDDLSSSAKGTVYYLEPLGVLSILPDGLVQAVAEGSAVVTASNTGLQDQVSVIVTGHEITDFWMEPAHVSLRPGDEASLVTWVRYSDGQTMDVTSVTDFRSANPTVATVTQSGLVHAISDGSTEIQAKYDQWSDSSSVEVTDNAELVAVEVTPDMVDIIVGMTSQLSVSALYSDGSSDDITSLAAYSSSDPSVAMVSDSGLVNGMAPGDALVAVSWGGFSDSSAVRVQQNPIPNISSINPVQIRTGDSNATLLVEGSGFIPSSLVLLDGADLTTTYLSDERLSAIVPEWAVQSVGQRAVSVFNPLPGGGESLSKTLLLVDTPIVSTISPNSGMRGSSVRVGFWGSGLLGCSITSENQGIGISNIIYHPTGLYLIATFSIADGATLGPASITLSNVAADTVSTFTVLEGSGYPDCVVSAGEVVYMSGVQTCNNVVIDTGAIVFGTGEQPLQIIATGRVEIRGDIDVSGFAGQDGFYNPADGGAAGPGGGGGGGGSDGELRGQAPSVGGAGSPAGQAGLGDLGAGTPSGDGGGLGSGSGVSGGCGQAGGGGGFGGDGGGGGGDLGVGTGGAGGRANTEGSFFNGGTGGGGGSTCGPNSGGGGGGGGGVLIIATTGGTITIEGVLFADGASGGDGFAGSGGGGGGSGGRITITSAGGHVRIEDTLSVRGGFGGRSDAGDAGGGGSGGYVLVDAGGGGVDDALGYYVVGGGLGGLSRDNGFDGESGQAGIADVQF